MKLIFGLLVRVLCFVFISSNIIAQSSHVLPGTLTDDIANRWEILYDFEDEIFSTQRNVSRQKLSLMALQFSKFQNSDTINASELDLVDANYIINDNFEYYHKNYIISDSDSEKVYDSTGVFYYTDDKEPVNELKLSRRAPIFKYFYKSKANFFEAKEENFSLVVNPILNLRYGNAIDDPNIIFQNTRGIELRGLIDNNIWTWQSFYWQWS